MGVHQTNVSPITVEQLTSTFDLLPHPEGGFFKETYRATEQAAQGALPSRFSGARALSTAIYYLLTAGSKSRFHRIASDEVWHFYLGGPLRIIEIRPDGEVKETVLGQDLLAGQRLQYVVPAGAWFGAIPEKGSAYSFVGCTVAPGFDFADFEIAKGSELLARYPHARAQIELLTDL